MYFEIMSSIFYSDNTKFFILLLHLLMFYQQEILNNCFSLLYNWFLSVPYSWNYLVNFSYQFQIQIRPANPRPLRRQRNWQRWLQPGVSDLPHTPSSVIHLKWLRIELFRTWFLQLFEIFKIITFPWRSYDYAILNSYLSLKFLWFLY